MRYKHLRDRFIGLKHRLESAEQDLRNTQSKLFRAKANRREWAMARDFFVEVAKLTQANVIRDLEATITLGLSIIPSEKPLEFTAAFETRRNQPELDMFVDDGSGAPVPLLSTIDTVGNSVEELVAFAAKLCLWSMQVPRSAPFYVQDEPFRSLKGENRIVAARTMKKLQEKLGLQMITVTNEPDLTTFSDKIIKCKKREGKTIVL